MEPNSEACQSGNPVETILDIPQRIMRESHATSRYFNPSISSDRDPSPRLGRKIFDSQTLASGNSIIYRDILATQANNKLNGKGLFPQ